MAPVLERSSAGGGATSVTVVAVWASTAPVPIAAISAAARIRLGYFMGCSFAGLNFHGGGCPAVACRQSRGPVVGTFPRVRPRPLYTSATPAPWPGYMALTHCRL